MNENFTSDTIENDDFNINPKESEYKNLITILKELKATIVLLEKQYTK